jgi:cysteinyl-tRNA synthetase
VTERREAFLAALADDFNTPRAIAQIFEIVAEGNRRPLAGAHAAVAELLAIVGLGSLATAGEEAPDAEAEALLAERQRARAERDFERADEIRERLTAMGWEVRDSAEGASLVRRD